MPADLAGRSVVYVNTYPGLGMGGGEVHLLHLVRGALGAGMRVVGVASSYPVEELRAAHRVVRSLSGLAPSELHALFPREA